MHDDIMAAEHACAKLALACYSWMDQGRYAEAAGLFANDATWIRGGNPVTGKDAILAALNKRSPDEISRHLVTNVIVTIDTDDTASATACFVPFRGPRAASGPGPLGDIDMLGDLAFRFVRIGGTWKIAHLQPRPVFKR